MREQRIAMRTRWKAIYPLLLGIAFGAVSLRAQIIETIGYGTGDNIEQAIVAAQGDAVLNANAKAVFTTAADGKKLHNDIGVISNEMFLVESTLLERGESFDGTYARVKLKVSKSEVQGRKNGFTEIVGEGVASTRGDAVLSALGNILILAGGKIMVYMESRNDELEKDETTISGSGFIQSFKELSVVEENGSFRAKVSAAVSPYAKEDSSVAGIRAHGTASGSDIGLLIAEARLKSILSSGAGYKYTMVFKGGADFTASLDRTILGVRSGLEAVISESDRKKSVSISGVTGSAASAFGAGKSNMVGYGFAGDDESAIAIARCDALLSRESAVTANSRVVIDKEAHSSMLLSGRSFVATKKHDRISGGIRVDAVVGENSSTVFNGDTLEFSAPGEGDSLSAAVTKAKFDAIMNSGVMMDAKMRFEDGVLKECETHGESTETIHGCNVEISQDAGRSRATATIVAGDISGTQHQPGNATGYGFDGDARTAFALARADVVLSHNSIARKESSFKLGEKPRETIRLTGSSFVMTKSPVAIDGGVIVESLVGDTASEVWPNGVFSVNGSGFGKDEEDAIAAARCDAVYKAGIMIDAEAEYSNGEMLTLKADCNCKANICGLSVVSLKRENGQCHAEVKIDISKDEHVLRPELIKVVGIGVAPTLYAARSAARANAVLNAKSTMTQEYNFRNGALSAGNCSFSGKSYFFDDSLQIEKSGRDYVVTSEVNLGDAHRELSEGVKSVRVKGFGSTAKEAIKDARQNAMDKVFGRKMSVMASGPHLGILHIAERAEEDGYVRSEKVISKSKNDFGWNVEMDAVVARRVKGWGWLKATIVFLILGGIMYAMKEKSVALYVIAGICFCLAMFATGHWVVGILLVLAFIGEFQLDN